MPGLVPGIHVFHMGSWRDVDGRDEARRGVGDFPLITVCGYGSRPSAGLRRDDVGRDDAATLAARNHSPSFLGSFDMRSSRSCISFIWRRNSSMLLLSSAGGGSGVFSASLRAG